MLKSMPDKERLAALLIKLDEAEAKLKLRLSRFRGVAHESASGELAYSELKVFEDYVNSLRAEVKALKEKLGLAK
jgi:hypothetical protein